jgi:hypothetical protein
LTSDGLLHYCSPLRSPGEKLAIGRRHVDEKPKDTATGDSARLIPRVAELRLMETRPSPATFPGGTVRTRSRSVAGTQTFAQCWGFQEFGEETSPGEVPRLLG